MISLSTLRLAHNQLPSRALPTLAMALGNLTLRRLEVSPPSVSGHFCSPLIASDGHLNLRRLVALDDDQGSLGVRLETEALCRALRRSPPVPCPPSPLTLLSKLPFARLPTWQLYSNPLALDSSFPDVLLRVQPSLAELDHVRLPVGGEDRRM